LLYQAIIKGKRLDLNLKIISLNLCENHNFPQLLIKNLSYFSDLPQLLT
jgi:hypothetical protein